MPNIYGTESFLFINMYHYFKEQVINLTLCTKYKLIIKLYLQLPLETKTLQTLIRR